MSTQGIRRGTSTTHQSSSKSESSPKPSVAKAASFMPFPSGLSPRKASAGAPREQESAQEQVDKGRAPKREGEPDHGEEGGEDEDGDDECVSARGQLPQVLGRCDVDDESREYCRERRGPCATEG